MAAPWNEKKALKTVQDRFRLMKDFRSGYEAQWNSNYKLYRAKKDKSRTDREGRVLNNLFIPKVYPHIETEMSQIMEANFSSRPVMTVMPRAEDDVKKAQVAEALLDYQIFAIPQFLVKYSNFTKGALIYGASMGMTTWKFEQDSTGRTVYDNPDFTPLDIFDWWADPMATTIDAAQDVVRKVIVTKEEIEDGLRRGWFTNEKNVKKLFKEKEKEIQEGREKRLQSLGVSVPDEAYEEKYELLEYWTDDRLVIVDSPNPKYVLGDGENPYGHSPFVLIVATPDPVSIYGVADVTMMGDLQLEYNTKRQQRIDNISLCLKKWFLANKFMDTDMDALANVQHGDVVETEDIDRAVKEMVTHDVTRGVDTELALLDKEMQDVTGAYNIMQGQLPSRKETATAVSAAVQQASARFRLKIQMMADMGLKELAKQIFKLDLKFMDRERVVRIVGERGVEWESVNREALQFEYDLVPQVEGVTAGKAVDKEQFLRFAAFMLEAFPQITNQYELAKRVAEKYDIKDISSILKEQPQQGMEGMPEQQGMQQGGEMQGMGGMMPQIPGTEGVM